MEEDKLILPLDIIINILKRLPVKSLLRFKCICKDWNNLFETSFFIKQHFHQSIHHRGSSLILQSNCFNYPRDYRQFNLLNSDKKTLMPMNAHPILQRGYFRRAHIIGSSYGIVCLYLKADSCIFLWNPATREVQDVPTNDAMNNNSGNLCHIGFGFGTGLDDCKIVNIHDPVSSSRRVEIYSVSTGSWKELPEFDNLQSVVFEETFTVTDEAMYWFASKKDDDGDPLFNNSRFIVSFNIAKEVFTLIPMPTSDFLVNNELITYENKLALLSRIELWVMKEEEEETTSSSGGSGQRWNKEFIGSPCLQGLYLMTVWRNEAVFRRIRQISGTEPKLFIYLLNLTTFKLKEFLIGPAKEFLIGPEHGCVLDSFNYGESLVTFGNKDAQLFYPWE